MASGNITDAQVGSALPLCYGPVRATGRKVVDYTGSDTAIFQCYECGEGEWDGPVNFFINNQIYVETYAGSGYFAQGNFGASLGGVANVHFHPGVDTPGDASFNLPPIDNSPGHFSLFTDQLLDEMWSHMPAVITPLMYSRVAYYWVAFKPTAGTSASLAPIGDFRTTRCRIFDANGNQTQYGYTLNPAWHFVDTSCRLAIKPEFGIQPIVGADHLTATEAACFDWESIVEAANYYDELLANGRKRFEGAYAFASTTTLAAIHEQILLCCRSYQQEYAGKISLVCDKPRPSVFLFDERHLVPGTFTADQKDVHAAANRYVGAFLDLELPVISSIASIVRSTSGGTTYCDIATTAPNPCAAGDVIETAGVTDPSFDGVYRVDSTSGETYFRAIAAVAGPAAASTGGSIGYCQSRFGSRTPELNHRQAQLAACRIPSSPAESATRSSSRTPNQLDFASTTYDQQNRLLKYEITRDLGPDVTPWKPPVTITLSAWSESVDDLGRILATLKCGERITVTDLVSWELAGDYELMGLTRHFFNWSQTSSISTDSAAGTLDLILRTYEETRFTDVSDAPTASFATLPGDDLWAGTGPVNSQYQVAYTALSAADAGSSATISVTGLQIQLGGGTPISYADASIVNLSYSTAYYVFVDDPYGRGGNIALEVTTNSGDLTAVLGRMFIGQVVTPAAGAPGVSGTGGGGSLPQPPKGGHPFPITEANAD